MTPIEYLKLGPKSEQDLIGKAKIVTQIFCGQAQSNDISPIRLLFYGPPGVGKSAACKLIAKALAKHPSDIRHVSAGQLTADHIRDWMNDLNYYNGEWKVYWIEEVDSVNPSVAVLLLQFMDSLVDRCAFLSTSNEKMSGIEDRFQSRCQTMRFERPKVDEVERFLLERWPELGVSAHEISEYNNGDVRASLNDAQNELNFRKFGSSKEVNNE